MTRASLARSATAVDSTPDITHARSSWWSVTRTVDSGTTMAPSLMRRAVSWYALFTNRAYTETERVANRAAPFHVKHFTDYIRLFLLTPLTGYGRLDR